MQKSSINLKRELETLEEKTDIINDLKNEINNMKTELLESNVI